MAIFQKKILCVDDDADDRLFLSEAINEANPDLSVVEAQNGVEAIDYLNAVRRNGDELPCLIVLDINMPYLDGKRTLQQIKADPFFEHIPVVIFTNSESPGDKNHFETYGVKLVTKPDNFAFMQQIAGNIISFCA